MRIIKQHQSSSTEEELTMQSIAETIELLDNSAYDVLHDYFVPQVKQTSTSTVLSPRYDTGLELLEDLPGLLVQLNPKSSLIPRKLMRLDPDTIFISHQLYRTINGHWKLVISPHNRSSFGTTAVSLDALVLVQHPLPVISSNEKQIKLSEQTKKPDSYHVEQYHKGNRIDNGMGDPPRYFQPY